MPPGSKKPPKPHIDQVQTWQKSDPNFAHDRFVPVTIFDGYGNIVGGPTNNPLPVTIAGGTINVGDIIMSDFDLNDGYGNPIGSVAGSLNVNIASGDLSINDGGGSITIDGTVNVGNFPTSFLSDTRDGYGNPIGSTSGGLNVFLANPSVSITNFPTSFDNDLHDGYSNPIGSVAGALSTHIASGDLSVNDGGGSLTVDGTVGISDGYGNLLGSQGGSLNTFITNTPHVIIDNGLSPNLNDGYGNPIGSTSGGLNVFLTNPTVSIGNFPTSFDNDLHDGYSNPIGSEFGALNVNIKDDYLPVTQGSGDYYSDETITVLGISPLFTSFTFGFISNGIILINDDSGAGTRDIEYSFNNFATVHGLLHKGEQIVFDHRRRTSIQIRGVGAARPYRLNAWG
jgi:hypothetical protein